MENLEERRRRGLLYIIAKFVLLGIYDRLSFFFFYHSFFPSSCRSSCLSAIQPNRNSLVDFQTRHRAKDFRFIMEIFNYLIIIHRRPSRNTQIIPRNYSRESIKIPLPFPPLPSLPPILSSLFTVAELRAKGIALSHREGWYLQLHKFYDGWNWTLLSSAAAGDRHRHL